MISGPVYKIGNESAGIPLLRMFHSIVPPFRRPYEEHRHTAFEISLICKGAGVYRAGEHQYPFRSGDVFLFSSNEPHCIVEVHSGTDLDIMNLQFESRFLWTPENLFFDVQYPDVFFKRNDHYSHKLSVEMEPARAVGAYLREIEREFQQKQIDYRLMVRLRTIRLLVLIRREYADYFNTPSEIVNTAYLVQMERALDYIDRNLTGELQLDKIAREAAMSPAYFSALFKKLNGLTPWEYVQSRRIELAAKKLVSSDRNIAEIAIECGYNSISNFNRRFKTITGLSPGDYRKSYCSENYGSSESFGKS